MNLKKLFLWICFVFTTMTFAQQNLSGSVKDVTGKPVAGASVTVFGTTRTTKTSPEGAYTIKAKEGEHHHHHTH